MDIRALKASPIRPAQSQDCPQTNTQNLPSYNEVYHG